MRKTILAIGIVILIAAISQSSALAMGKLKKTDTVEKQSPIENQTEKKTALPKLVDLGAKKCIPCKMMAPILDELKAEYKGKMDVVFIDVWQQPDEGKKYSIRMIPTQIFYASDGKELFRHQGFFSKEDILATWKKYGYEFKE